MKGMSKKKNKSRKRTVPAGRGRVVVLGVGSDPKMSEVILELADPLLDGVVSEQRRQDTKLECWRE